MAGLSTARLCFGGASAMAVKGVGEELGSDVGASGLSVSAVSVHWPLHNTRHVFVPSGGSGLVVEKRPQ